MTGRRLLLLALLVALVFPRASHAYLDPTSGSIFLQVLLGGVAGAALAIKLFWHKVVGWLGVGSRDRDDSSA